MVTLERMSSVAVLAAAICGCGSGSGDAASSPPGAGGAGVGGASGASGAAGAAAGMAGTGGASKPAIPGDLRSFEANSEGVNEAARDKNWVKAQGILDQANMTWATLKPALVADGAGGAPLGGIEDALAKIAVAIASKTSKDGEIHGNRIQLVVPDLFDLYSFSVPSDALRLDAVYRQIQIDAEYSDWTPAAAHAPALLGTWQKLRAATDTRAKARTDIKGNDTIVADIDANIASCQKALDAKDAAALQTLTQTGLDLVDTVEQVFE